MSDEHLYDDPAHSTTTKPRGHVTLSDVMLREILDRHDLIEFARMVRSVSRNAVKVRRLCDEAIAGVSQ